MIRAIQRAHGRKVFFFLCISCFETESISIHSNYLSVSSCNSKRRIRFQNSDGLWLLQILVKHSEVDFLFKYVQCRLFYNVSSGLLWSVIKLLTHANFTSPSLSDFNQSGVLECLWVLKKAEKTPKPLERKVKTLLTEAHCRECPEIKQKVGDSLFTEESCPRNI